MNSGIYDSKFMVLRDRLNRDTRSEINHIDSMYVYYRPSMYTMSILSTVDTLIELKYYFYIIF